MNFSFVAVIVVVDLHRLTQSSLDHSRHPILELIAKFNSKSRVEPSKLVSNQVLSTKPRVRCHLRLILIFIFISEDTNVTYSIQTYSKTGSGPPDTLFQEYNRVCSFFFLSVVHHYLCAKLIFIASLYIACIYPHRELSECDRRRTLLACLYWSSVVRLGH